MKQQAAERRKHRGYFADGSPVRNPEGKIIGASKIARDITERRRAEEQQRLLLERWITRQESIRISRRPGGPQCTLGNYPEELSRRCGIDWWRWHGHTHSHCGDFGGWQANGAVNDAALWSRPSFLPTTSTEDDGAPVTIKRARYSARGRLN